MDEKEKMLSGEVYDPSDEALAKQRAKAHELCLEYNTLKETDPRREEILQDLFPDHGERLFLQGPIQFDYGCNTHFGRGVYANFNFTVLDIGPIEIGDNVFFGPNVSLYGALHPLVSEERIPYQKEDGSFTDHEYGKSITIGEGCWIGGGVSILAGVHIGPRCVIGAGSVVTRDIPADSLAFGNPCHVKRRITEEDRILNKKIRD